MDNVMQFLFNTNHEQPSILVWILLIVIAVVIPNYARYRMILFPPRTLPVLPRARRSAAKSAEPQAEIVWYGAPAVPQ